MRMLKNIIFSIVALLATFQNSFAQWENDGKGLNYKQLYGCQDTTGVRLDSMFRMTDSTGKLTICLSIGDLIDIINNYGGDGGGEGGGGNGFGCDSVEICLNNGALCDALKNFSNANYTSGNRLFGVDNGGQCKKFDIMGVPGVGDTCRVVNNTNGSYSHFNENNREKVFGYHLLCKDDSTLVLTDWDGTHIDSCEILGSAGGGGGNNGYTLDCDSVKLCLQDGILCEVLSELEMGTSAPGQKYVTIQDGECVLTDSIIIDICGILDQIQEESDLREDDIFFIQRPSAGNACFKVPWGLLSTDCIALTMEAGDLRADIITDPSPPSPYRKVYCGENGLYADSASIDCDQLRNKFASGTYDSNDHILSFDGTTDECEWITIPKQGSINCDTIKNIFNQIATTADTILGFSNGECVRVSVDALACPQNLATWDGDCSPAYLIVQCFVPGSGWVCQKMPCTQFDTWYGDGACSGQNLKAPFKTEQDGDYPTIQNLGVRSFKSKRQAEMSDIPIGGIYMIEKKGTILVKTRQRK